MKQLFTTIVALFVGFGALQAATPIEKFPKQIYSGEWKAGHIQGIAVDAKQGYIYYSFTTMLIKADLQGNIIGTVTGLLGHLGCIEFNEEDGRIYGSLEYKNDSIGRGILKQENTTKHWDTAFYVAIFDVDKITREGMSAEKDGIMTSIYLPTVLEDFVSANHPDPVHSMWDVDELQQPHPDEKADLPIFPVCHDWLVAH